MHVALRKQIRFDTAIIAGCQGHKLITVFSSYEYVGTVMSHAAPGQCKSTLKPGTLTFIAPGANGLYSKTSRFLATASPIFGAQVNGYMTPGTSSTTSTISSTLTSLATSTTTSSTNSASQTATPPPASGLPTGAKAGIGGGVGALALLALLGAFLWYRRRHRYKSVELATGSGSPPVGGYYPPTENKGPVQEIDGSRTDVPLGGYYQPKKNQPAQELSSQQNKPTELP